MKVIIATLGGSEIPILAAARKPGLDKAILISGMPASEIFDEPLLLPLIYPTSFLSLSYILLYF